MKIAIVVATKDRPEKLGNLLDSIASQEVLPECVVVVSSGDPVDEVIARFEDRLNLRHEHLQESGQVIQRNRAIQMVSDSVDLIGCLDDDITLEPGCLPVMLGAWDSRGDETIGLGFNIINEPRHQFRPAFAWCGLSVKEPGQVMKCGTPSSITNVVSDIESQWLNGGTTVWRASVLKGILHSPIQSEWAVYEDLIFSYPLRKTGKMGIIADARVVHNDVGEQAIELKRLIYRGEQKTFWRYVFVTANRESLSFSSYFLRVGVDLAHGLVRCLRYPKRGWGKFAGTIIGGAKAFGLMLSGSDSFKAYYDDTK